MLELNSRLARALTYVPASNRLTLYALDGDRATPLASETPPKLVLVASSGAHIACAFHEGEKDEILRPGVVELRNWQDLAVITRITLPRVWFQSMALAPDATLIAIASTAENTLLMSTRDGKLIADFPGGEYITGLGFDQTSQRLSGLSTGQGGGYIGLTCQSGSEWAPETLPTPPLPSHKCAFPSRAPASRLAARRLTRTPSRDHFGVPIYDNETRLDSR